MKRADDKFRLDDKEKTEAPFSNFELLERKVEHLADLINEHAEILRHNGLSLKIQPSAFSDQEVFSSFMDEQEEMCMQNLEYLRSTSIPKSNRKTLAPNKLSSDPVNSDDEISSGNEDYEKEEDYLDQGDDEDEDEEVEESEGFDEEESAPKPPSRQLPKLPKSK